MLFILDDDDDNMFCWALGVHLNMNFKKEELLRLI